jgi:RNA:NAD 2'-phosphotransferase (TPT1/KptA family)
MREAPYSIDAHLQEPPPDVLYHYTSMEAAISIVKNTAIWATDISYLNDSSEYHKVLQAIRRRLDHRIPATQDTSQRTNLETYRD